MKKILLMLVLMITLVFAAACGGGGGEGDGGDGGGQLPATKYRVQLIVSPGITVNGEKVIEVESGKDAEFTVNFPADMIFKGIDAGDPSVDCSFDHATGKVTIIGVSKNLRVQLNAEKATEDAAKYTYSFYGTDYDTSSLANGEYYEGTSIVLKAGDNRVFEGWSFGGTISGGGTLISRDREVTFTLSDKYANDGVCYVFPNYANKNMIKYLTNGGDINYRSQNLTSTKYYTVAPVGGEVNVTFTTQYFEEIGVAYTFWDDGSFYRDGYILKEYNTRPDGSGEGFGMGSKYPMTDGGVLYCIWEKDTEHADFSYTGVTIPLPTGASYSGIPGWIDDGIMITGYSGDAQTVTIPEKIDGKYVIAIGQGAFKNKSLKTLVMGRRVAKIEDGAFVGCSSLDTIYYPDGIAYIGNDALDAASYKNLKHLYVNATIAPRFSSSEGGCFANKLTRLMANADKQRLIVISGSSSYCGFSVEYMEALMDNDVCVVNFGTTRTTHIYMYLEAMQHFAKEGDVILYAPENSIYEMGEPRLYWKTLRDLEGMYNIFRYVDISGFTNIFGAFSEFNIGSSSDEYDPLVKGRFARSAGEYGDIINVKSFNEYGEYNVNAMNGYLAEDNYKNVYEITLNNRFKSIFEGSFLNSKPEEEPWQTSDKWCSADDSVYVTNMNRAINAARSSGAKVYFSYAPMDYSAICKEAKADLDSWLSAYEKFIADTYDFDGIIGEAKNYMFDHKYFYNNAYHTNNYGRVYRTHRMYVDVASIFGISNPKRVLDGAGVYDGCLFEKDAVNGPVTGVKFD